MSGPANTPKPWLKLSPPERAIAKMLKERHRMDWPLAAIIARDVVALRVTDGSLELPVDWDDRPLRPRKKAPRRYAEHERQAVLEEFADSQAIMEEPIP